MNGVICQMKKNYSTPRIVFDSFELSERIAADCAAYSNQAEYVCPVIIKGYPWTIFMEDSDCDASGPKMYDMVCYDVPPNDDKVFSS